PETAECAVKCHTAGGHSPRTYIRESGDRKLLGSISILKANALIAETWICAVFQDGTVFFNGALHGRRILNSGRTLALRLPKLPAGFVYGEFAISDATLYAAWEETSFFKTGRSGFIAVDLDELLYKNGAL
ncbi:MAG: hypothetical protein K2H09_03720, partial [Treponemataceae bacterium]|nr:hypothetical protein [Treponemataceae bacterium]